VPFSLLGAVQNQRRDWVIDKIAIGVTYDSDLEKARKLIKQVGLELQKDPEFAPLILEPLKMQGVENLGDFAVQIRAKMMTLPGAQFVIRRKAYAMIKKAFDENCIKFAFPTVQVAGETEAAGAPLRNALWSSPTPPLKLQNSRSLFERGNRREDGARPNGVLRDLRLQRLEPGKLALGADEFDQRHPQMPPVEIDIGIEKVRLEPRYETADGRAQSEVGDAVDRAPGQRIVGTIAADAHRVNAKGGLQIVVETEIGGRKADRPPALVTDGDAPVDLPEAAEQGRRLARPTRLQQFADLRRGIDRRVSAAYRFEDSDAKPALRTCRAQHVRAPATPIAEGAVPADDDMAGADRTHDHLGDKVFRGFGGKSEIEMLDEQQVDPKPSQLPLFDPERRQAKRLGARKKYAPRMRFEGQHPARPALCLSEFADAADQRRMAAMQPVEIAHGQHRTTRMAGIWAGMSNDADHGIRRASSSAKCCQNRPPRPPWIAGREHRTTGPSFGHLRFRPAG
jgi:hypothetical protein